MSPAVRGKRLGILGGGQLGRMIAEAALRRGLRVRVLSPEERVPAAIPDVELVRGELDDETALEALIDACDCVTIENEFLDTGRIAAVLERHPDVRFRPGLDAIATAQDKLAQKRLFAELAIPTADHTEVPAADAVAQLPSLRERYPGGFVLKWSRFGYDGRGNLVVRADTDPDAVATFCRNAADSGAAIYAEELIDFVDECAMVVTRSDAGALRCYPLVQSVQERGICREVLAPATALGLPADLEDQARAVLGAIGERLSFCGTFAVEFFRTTDGQLLANEMAPRVHNTGHYTLYDEEPSQFELHVQAVMQLPVTAPRISGPALMRNLLGPVDGPVQQDCPRPSLPPPAGVELYWYDKPSVSPGRKMGHLSARAADAAALRRLAGELAAWEAVLWRQLLVDTDSSTGRTSTGHAR